MENGKKLDVEKFVPYGCYSETIKEYITVRENGKQDANWSAIETKLIQLAGRYCDRFASDIIIDINSIQKKLDSGELKAGDVFLFGFRESGVDHKDWVLSSDYKGLDARYIKIYRLDIVPDDEYITEVLLMKLYRVEYNPYM